MTQTGNRQQTPPSEPVADNHRRCGRFRHCLSRGRRSLCRIL